MLDSLEAFAKKRAASVSAVYHEHKTEVITVFVFGFLIGWFMG